uniref:Uncharacterized protein n=1 Tax=Rhizophora mucronata TaxID=61149 RepID=A0A2P2MXS4_RHIMU
MNFSNTSLLILQSSVTRLWAWKLNERV